MRGSAGRRSCDCTLRENERTVLRGGTTKSSVTPRIFSGKYRSEADLSQSQRGSRVAKYLNPRGFAILDALDRVAAAHDATPAEVALAWMIASPGVTAPIASATSLDQLKSLVKALELSLTAEEMTALDQAGA